MQHQVGYGGGVEAEEEMRKMDEEGDE